jgi:hypothetical protein
MRKIDNIQVVAIRLLPEHRSLRALVDVGIGNWIGHACRIFSFHWAVGSSQDMEGIEPGDFPIYQWQEIQQLIDDQVEPAMLRAIHSTKRIFPGAIVICEKK